MKRLFVGLPIPAATAAALVAQQAALAALPEPQAKLRLTAPDHLHLTLKFLGDTIDAQVEELVRALQNVAAHTPSLEAHLAGLDAFPSAERPRAIVAAVDRGANALQDLMARVDAACAPLGFAADTRPRVPHVTLARLSAVVSGGHIHRWLREHLRTPYGQVPADTIILYESSPSPHGSLYTALASCST